MLHYLWSWFVLVISVAVAILFVAEGPVMIAREEWRRWRRRSRLS